MNGTKDILLTTKTEQAKKSAFTMPALQGSNRRLPPLETRFKKGQSGNPKGRKPSVLTKHERLELLSEMAKMNKHKANPVQAIHEQNLMEGVFLEIQPSLQDNRVIYIVVGSEKAKELTESVSEWLLPKE